MIIPALGQAFIIEDTEDFGRLEDAGITIPESAKKGVGTTGIIYAITPMQRGFLQSLRHWLFADYFVTKYDKGDRVIFDRFIAHDLFVKDENGREIKNLRAVPIDCILAKFI